MKYHFIIWTLTLGTNLYNSCTDDLLLLFYDLGQSTKQLQNALLNPSCNNFTSKKEEYTSEFSTNSIYMYLSHILMCQGINYKWNIECIKYILISCDLLLGLYKIASHREHDDYFVLCYLMECRWNIYWSSKFMIIFILYCNFNNCHKI